MLNADEPSDKEKHPDLVLGVRNHCRRSRGEKNITIETKTAQSPPTEGEALRRKRTRRSDKRRLEHRFVPVNNFYEFQEVTPFFSPPLGIISFSACGKNPCLMTDRLDCLKRERKICRPSLSHGGFREIITTSRKLSREIRFFPLSKDSSFLTSV